MPHDTGEGDELVPRAGRGMMLPATCTTKLAKLVPLLGSDRDGEVLAAARAIGRTLAASGADFHDLVLAIGGERDEPPKRQRWEWSPPPPPKPPSPDESAWWVQTRGAELLARDLGGHERRFVQQMMFNAAKKKIGFSWSPKQASWFRDLLDMYSVPS